MTGDDVGRVVDLDSHRAPEWASYVDQCDAGSERSRGWRHVTLLHGEPEDQADAALLARLDQVAASLAPADGAMFRRGGGDWASWVYISSNPTLNRRAADRLATWIRSNARHWWRMRMDGTIPRMSDQHIDPPSLTARLMGISQAEAEELGEAMGRVFDAAIERDTAPGLSYAAAVDQLERSQHRASQLWQQLQAAGRRSRRRARRAFMLGIAAGGLLTSLVATLLAVLR